MTIASEFLHARIAAFTRAHGALRLCKSCLDRGVAARRLTAVPGRGDAAELVDPSRDWCFQCGVSAPTLPALPRSPQAVPRTPRPARRAA
ncbi:MAG: hypothetical protein FJ027_21120 [Candidatus Rokubacteria bacterium]|nr:hypothetical protein [Candidatus Rokubacteria bacterium]